MPQEKKKKCHLESTRVCAIKWCCCGSKLNLTTHMLLLLKYLTINRVKRACNPSHGVRIVKAERMRSCISSFHINPFLHFACAQFSCPVGKWKQEKWVTSRAGSRKGTWAWRAAPVPGDLVLAWGKRFKELLKKSGVVQISQEEEAPRCSFQPGPLLWENLKKQECSHFF